MVFSLYVFEYTFVCDGAETARRILTLSVVFNDWGTRLKWVSWWNHYTDIGIGWGSDRPYRSMSIEVGVVLKRPE